MPVLMTYGETSTVIKADLTSYLAAVSKVIGDITEATLMVKSDLTLADNLAEYENTSPSYSANEIRFNVTDFSGITANQEYFFKIALKFSGDVTFRELKAKANQDTIIFEQDLIRG